jgi:hypothetical protein
MWHSTWKNNSPSLSFGASAVCCHEHRCGNLRSALYHGLLRISLVTGRTQNMVLKNVASYNMSAMLRRASEFRLPVPPTFFPVPDANTTMEHNARFSWMIASGARAFYWSKFPLLSTFGTVHGDHSFVIHGFITLRGGGCWRQRP